MCLFVTMEEIFHEKQEGSLCAQHCLNALLQGPYFTAVELASLGRQIDEEERSRMAEGGVLSEDYRKFVQQPSGNVDDSGYFSVQVIASALKVWRLELIPYNSQHVIAQCAKRDPTQETAYICNYLDHWFSIRKIGYQWFNLNSLLTGPELISDTFLALYLAQLQNEGNSIFIVAGKLPDCSADKILKLQPAVQIEKPKLISEVKGNAYPQEDEDKALKEVLKKTLQESQKLEDDCMQAALSMSLNEYQSACSSSQSKSDMPSTSQGNQTTPPEVSSIREMTEQEMLEAAIKMSMEES